MRGHTALDSSRRPGPEGGGESPSQGRPCGIFKRALQRRNVVGALAAARELPELGLIDALDLTMLVARNAPGAISESQPRWLLRYLEEDPEATIDEAALAASSLIAHIGVS